ncbi:MAG: ABC transporter substrate-binding protein [Candidatus Rokubacteria bacterium]|nr:ABC transporter substrate-binding protein [Candidatus Rokubacteria bacterium]
MRKAFIISLVLGFLVAPIMVEAQAPAKVPRIGFLSPLSPTDNPHVLEAFRQGLRELGYVEGQTIAIEYRIGEGRPERLPALAADLVRLKVDVIVTGGAAASEVARRATSTIPIVFAVTDDPVAEGLVASLARPGGNITGLASIGGEVVGKQLELLKEVAPKVSRVAVLQNPSNPGHPHNLRRAEGAARALGLQLQVLEARTPAEIDAAFAAMRSQRAGGVLVLRDPLFHTQRTQIAALAAKSRLPAVYGIREQAEAGGLMAYGANVLLMYRRAATYVDRILKGAKPSDLPVEQPTKFELVVNLKTAKAAGLTIPQSILLRADEVIQ